MVAKDVYHLKLISVREKIFYLVSHHLKFALLPYNYNNKKVVKESWGRGGKGSMSPPKICDLSCIIGSEVM